MSPRNTEEANTLDYLLEDLPEPHDHVGAWISEYLLWNDEFNTWYTAPESGIYDHKKYATNDPSTWNWVQDWQQGTSEPTDYEVIELFLVLIQLGKATPKQLTQLKNLLELRLDHKLPWGEEWETEEYIRQQRGCLPVICIRALDREMAPESLEINGLLIDIVDLFVKIGVKDALESVDEGIEYHWVTATDLVATAASSGAQCIPRERAREWEVAARYISQHYDENNQLRTAEDADAQLANEAKDADEGNSS